MINAIRTLTGATLAALSVTAAVTTAAPTEAASCYYKSGQEITPAELAQLQPGVTTAPEARIVVGSAGIPMDPIWMVRESGVMERTWHTCARTGSVTVSYQRVPGQGFVLQWTAARWS